MVGRHVAHVVQARQHGMATRRRRVPNARFPLLVESDYAHRLVELVGRWQHAARHLTAALPAILLQSPAFRHDIDPGGVANQVMERVRTEAQDSVTDNGVSSMARDYGGMVVEHQRKEIVRQAKAALGVEVQFHDPRLAPVLRQFIHENVSLVRKLRGATLDHLETIVHRGIASGASPDDIGSEISKRFGVSERHARFIARDQVQKLNSAVTELRHAELGIREFDWWTMRDPKVRPAHKVLHGRRFAYSDPPLDLPGRACGCRCLQKPVFDGMLADVAAAQAAGRFGFFH